MNSFSSRLHKAWAFFIRDLRLDLSYRVSFMLDAVNVLTTVAAFYFLSKTMGDRVTGSYQPFPFLLLGLAVNGYLSMALHCYSQGIRGSQTSGVIKAVLGAPIGTGEFLFYSSFYPLFRAGLDGAIYLTGGVALGLSLERANLPAVLLLFLLSVASHAGVGIISAAFTVLFKKGDPVVWIFGGASWLLGGVFYPLEILPEWMQRAAELLPLSHALRGTRAAVLQGASISQLIPEITSLLAFLAVSLPAGVIAFHAAVRRGRQTGSLGHA